MTEAEWLACEWPTEMLRDLDGKVPNEAFIPFSVACCRRIWTLITDPRARAVVEATEAATQGVMGWDIFGQVYDLWDEAYSNGDVTDLAGGITNDALESVCGLGDGHALQVCMSCWQAAGYAAAEPLVAAGVPQAERTKVWQAAEAAERLAQCQLLRQMFGYPCVSSRTHA